MLGEALVLGEALGVPLAEVVGVGEPLAPGGIVGPATEDEPPEQAEIAAEASMVKVV